MADATVIPLGNHDRSRGQGSVNAGSRETQEPEPLLRDVLGDVLRRTRLEQRRTLAEVADEARVSTPYLSEIERGRKEASSEVLSAVCRALGLRVIDLISRTQVDLAQRDEVLREAQQLTSLRLRSRFDPRNSPVALAA